MIEKANKTYYFNYKREEGQNPNIGFMSFQHFRDEALYSDCIVRPENNMTETEHYECYPVPEYVEENGRSEGYYPDTSVAYIRILWKEWEPERGKYRYDFIQSIIDKAREHNQTLTFRLMAHSTRACDDVPDWLKELIDCPERPDGKRVKDSPTDPLFLELFCEAIKKLGDRFDSDPTFYAIDISLPGAWGEGHKLELYPEEDLKRLFNTYISTFKNTRLIGQVFRSHLIKWASQSCSIGIRGDGFGSPDHIYELYPPAFEELSNLWQLSPVSFESYWWLGEWKRQGWDIDEAIQLSLKWHVSTFNAKSLPVPFEWKDKIDVWLDKMGYHYVIDYFKCPEKAKKGGEIELKLGIDNVGVAPMYDKIPLYVRFVGEKTWESKTNIDVTKWLPGKSAERFTAVLPHDVDSGIYDVEIGIYGQNYPMVYFATDAVRNGKYYKVGKVEIE